MDDLESSLPAGRTPEDPLAARLAALDPELAAIGERLGDSGATAAAELSLSVRAFERGARLVRAWSRAGNALDTVVAPAEVLRMRELFEAALDLPPEERVGFVRLVCGSEPALLAMLETLLGADADQESGGTSDAGIAPGEGAQERAPTAASLGATPTPVPAVASAGSKSSEPEWFVGRFRILREIASGGMGTVYEAEQESPRRRVALKMLDLSLSTPAMRRRFEYESEILAELHHPGIAAVYESGVHVVQAGPQRREVPWFALEYVEGARDLLAFAAAEAPAVEGRLELFLQVCRAVQYGHGLGVIHRDLKPHNLLVDRNGRVRVIDFGVARATGPKTAPGTLLTAVGEVVGTLRYMAPEQLEPDGGPPDVRVDVYALGVVLYELLCDEPPLALENLSLTAAARVVHDEAPRRPRALRPELSGDLEAICLTALAKEPARRYPSVEALAADVEHFLAHEPVAARAPSSIYRFGLFARRNKLLVASVAALFAALAGVAGLALKSAAERERAAVLLRAERDVALDARSAEARERASAERERASAERERERAEAAEVEAQDQLARTQLEAQKSDAVRGFLEEMLLSAHPARTGREARVADVLDGFGAAIERRFATFPEVQAALRRVSGSTYSGLGLFDEAAYELVRAHRSFVESAGAESPDALAAAEALAFARQGQGRLEEAETLRRDALAARERNDAEAASTQVARSQLALLLVDRGRYTEAEELFTRALDGLRSAGATERETIPIEEGYAQLLLFLDRTDEAEALVRRALEFYRAVHGAEDGRTLQAMSSLVTLLARRGSTDEAIELGLELAEVRVDVFGELHSHSIGAMQHVGELLRQQGRLAEARPWLERALAAQLEAYGEEHQDTPVLQTSLGALRQYQGDLRGAEELYRSSASTAARVLGPEHPRTWMAAQNLAGVLWMQGRNEEAAGTAREACAGLERVFPPAHPFPLAARSQLASILWDLGERDEAERVLADVLLVQTGSLGPRHPDRLVSLAYLAGFALEQDRLDEALSLGREAYELQRELYGPNHAETLNSLDVLVRVQEARGAFDEAETLASELVLGRSAIGGEDDDATRTARNRLERIRASREEER